jgi:alpha-galactosidase
VISTEGTSVWTSRDATSKARYIAVFNLQGSEQMLVYPWNQLGLAGTKYRLRDLWEHKDLGAVDSLSVTLASHACALYKATPQ